MCRLRRVREVNWLVQVANVYLVASMVILLREEHLKQTISMNWLKTTKTMSTKITKPNSNQQVENLETQTIQAAVTNNNYLINSRMQTNSFKNR